MTAVGGEPGAPFLSFLTTAYRTEHYLPATIASVLAQTRSDWELIVVDNGNDDAIAAVVQAHADHDSRVRLVRQSNRGYVGGLSAAADVARGEVVVPLDSDDQLMPDFASRVHEFFDAHPDAGALACDAHLFTDERDRPHGRGYLRSVGIPLPPRGGTRLQVTDILAGHVPYYGAAIRRTAWVSVGGYGAADDGVDESVDIWLRLAERFTIYMIPDRLARYRVRRDSISRHPDSVESFEDALIATFLRHAGRGGTDVEGRQAARTAVRQLRYDRALRRGRWALQENRVDEARDHLRLAWGERRTTRVGAILLLLRLAPLLLLRVHPLKQRLGRWVSDHVPQRNWRPRGPGSASPPDEADQRDVRRVSDDVGPTT